MQVPRPGFCDAAIGRVQEAIPLGSVFPGDSNLQSAWEPWPQMSPKKKVACCTSSKFYLADHFCSCEDHSLLKPAHLGHRARTRGMDAQLPQKAPYPHRVSHLGKKSS